MKLTIIKQRSFNELIIRYLNRYKLRPYITADTVAGQSSFSFSNPQDHWQGWSQEFYFYGQETLMPSEKSVWTIFISFNDRAGSVFLPMMILWRVTSLTMEEAL